MFGDRATDSQEKEAIEGSQPTVIAPPVPDTTTSTSSAALVMEDGTIIPVTEGEVFIGRHRENNIRIPDVRVSRRHARLVGTGDRFELHNLTAVRSEPNPIVINGVEREHAELHDGDHVSLGGVRLTFRA
jgi:hypothetical protein